MMLHPLLHLTSIALAPLFPWQPRFSTNSGWYPGQVVASDMMADCCNSCCETLGLGQESQLCVSTLDRHRLSLTLFLAFNFREWWSKLSRRCVHVWRRWLPVRHHKNVSFQNIFQGDEYIGLMSFRPKTAAFCSERSTVFGKCSKWAKFTAP